MEHNNELRTAWEFVENTGRSIFLTGKAGTGKTTFLRTVAARSKKRSIVVAPTGIAAINAGGVTIHSFFQLPFAPFVPDATLKSKYDFGKEKRRIISTLDLLIIDEISMVRSDLLDAIDYVLRRYRNHFMPFGGVQLLMIGDLQQLTPVVTPEDEQLLKPHYDTPYFFGSKALSKIDYVTIQLEKVFRQQDSIFINLLNDIREGRTTDEDLRILNAHYRPNFTPPQEEGYIRLTSHNRLADQQNEYQLSQLTTPPHQYRASIEGTFPDYSYPTAETLELKVGTQVMFVKNDPSSKHLYYNGKIGQVTHLDKDTIMVKCPEDNSVIEVEPLVWENTRYTINSKSREIESEVQGTFKQFPLRLAWAITIHKSQGLTFDRAIIDASHSFAPGQVYVALSRCRTLEGMVLSSPLQRHAIINDTRVDDYISQQTINAQKSIERLPLLKEEYFRYLMSDLFNFQQLKYAQQRMVRIFTEHLSRSHPNLEALQKETQQQLDKKVISVAEKWTSIICQSPMETLHESDFLNRVKRSAGYFATTLDELFTKPARLTALVQTGNKQVMAQLDTAFAELCQAWKPHSKVLRKMEEKGFTVSGYLREKQMAILDTLDEGKGKASAKNRREKKEKPPKEKTWETTYKLFRAGMTPQQIAVERDLANSTIIGHLVKYLDKGELTIDDIVTPDHQQEIRRIIGIVGTESGLAAIKALCPTDVTYDEIRLMMYGRI